MVVLQSIENTSYETFLCTKRKLWSRKLSFFIFFEWLFTYFFTAHLVDEKDYYSVVYHGENKLKPLESWVCTDKEAGRMGMNRERPSPLSWEFHRYTDNHSGLTTSKVTMWLRSMSATGNQWHKMPTMWKGVSLCPSHYAKYQKKFTLNFLIHAFLNSILRAKWSSENMLVHC